MYCDVVKAREVLQEAVAEYVGRRNIRQWMAWALCGSWAVDKKLLFVNEGYRVVFDKEKDQCLSHY